eukprot:4727981-Pleurochrysis_carterae.AAC.1
MASGMLGPASWVSVLRTCNARGGRSTWGEAGSHCRACRDNKRGAHRADSLGLARQSRTPGAEEASRCRTRTQQGHLPWAGWGLERVCVRRRPARQRVPRARLSRRCVSDARRRPSRACSCARCAPTAAARPAAACAGRRPPYLPADSAAASRACARLCESAAHTAGRTRGLRASEGGCRAQA